MAITPNGSFAYVANNGAGTVSVIDTATNLVVGPPIMVGAAPFGVAVTPDGSRAYVTNSGGNTVSVIAIEKCTGSLCFDFGSGTGSGTGSGSFFS
ncbi:YncE family protein [Rhodococcus marinonascens]|uniref:YncE family protein n=1 Tax=Rhodococcus marinonascens TaxID=38311 RepID=UPI000934CAC8|nr:hypothetical protein [Rhodococcus marinonascens]